MTAPAVSPKAHHRGGLLLWFAVLGGAIAWALHLAAAWSTDELACFAGHHEISGTPLYVVITLMVVIPGVIALAALGTALLVRHRTSGTAVEEGRPDGTRRDRTRLLATVGIWANLLFVAIIAFDGVAVVVIPQCRS
ncbi:hypothetical protein ORV05_17885 [Amycolatopsis cynarae]|uniref:Uncharacterized protein n=1 Tax=Amycolatopsis cynarae TaxID=2995223 RepID=A0ABY7BBR3_9PSEU|nr:hypothetical protein [Amycolatopsis sp. HUAS 11-8]WAL69561.1 hypothetical protein ORV05_17885 [Amycolatopsis sp. HUAS 11-8]